jgi:hypothetical protein
MMNPFFRTPPCRGRGKEGSAGHRLVGPGPMGGHRAARHGAAFVDC